MDFRFFGEQKSSKETNEWEQRNGYQKVAFFCYGCIFLDLPFLWSKKRFFIEKSLLIGIYPTADFLIYMHCEIVNNTWHISNKDYEAKRATATAA